MQRTPSLVRGHLALNAKAEKREGRYSPATFAPRNEEATNVLAIEFIGKLVPPA
jgi:hypothetical protein